MTTPPQDRLRPGEQDLLREKLGAIVAEWAAVLLGVDISELDEHPYSEVVLEEISAAVLIRDEVVAYISRLERRAARYVTQARIAERLDCTPQAVSLRLKRG